jgi:hypothetical protein
MEGHKKVVYTVVLGEYDELSPAPKFEGWDFIVFTDDILLNADGWTKYLVEGGKDLQKESRRYKFLSHLYLKEYDLVCYIDGNVRLISEPPNHPIWFTHRIRNSVYEEAMTRSIDVDMIKRQIRYYMELRFTDKGGLYHNNFFVRSNRNDVQNKLMEKVWDIVSEHTPVDELAVPFAMWVTQTRMENIQSQALQSRYIKVKAHKKQIEDKKKVNVHHITPGRSDKNIGRAINEIVKALPDNDWICLRDIDTLPMYHEKIYQQCEQIAQAGEFDLVGCMTNRLGLHYQLVGGRKSNDSDILNHRKIGVDLYKEHGNDIMAIQQVIGGLFMLFPKSTWKTVGGFPEGGIQIQGHFFDYHFCKKVMQKRLRIGIAKGIYLFHYYRFEHKEDTRKAISHLL